MGTPSTPNYFEGYEPGPVNAEDVVYAEMQTTLGDLTNKQTLDEFVTTIAASLKRTLQDGQELIGVARNASDRELQTLVRVGVRDVLQAAEASNADIEIPEGCILVTVTKIAGQQGVYATPKTGKSFHVQANGSSGTLEEGMQIIVRPTGEFDGARTQKPYAELVSIAA